MKEEITPQINETLEKLIETFRTFPPEKVNVIPFDKSWTPGQVVQHIILSCSGFQKLISGPEAEANRPLDQGVAQIKLMLESDEKMQSPKEIDPQFKEYDQERQIQKLNELKTAITSTIASNKLDVLATAFEFPEGFLTKYQAACFVLYHTQRHIKQLQNMARYLLAT